jgi:hypothetical protein
MCTLIKGNIKKLKYNRKNIYVLTIKIYNSTTDEIHSVCIYSRKWKLNKINTDLFFNKNKINNFLNGINDKKFKKGMFHSTPFSISNFNLISRDLHSWGFEHNIPKIYLSVIPHNSYITYGINYNCSYRLDGNESILSNKLKLLEEIDSIEHLRELIKKYKITKYNCSYK